MRATIASARLAIADGEAAAARRLQADVRGLFDSEDAQEGIRSFIERRPGDFVGR